MTTNPHTDKLRLAKLLQEKEKRDCERSFAEFVKSSWHIIEPSTPLIWNWYLDVICGYLEAVHEGKIKRLIINVPPGSMKSTLVSVCYPAWVWIHNKSHRFLGITNAQTLALRDAGKAKDIIESKWYQNNWPVAFKKSQNEKMLYQVLEGGFRQSLGIHANITGKRGDTMLIDDANDSTLVESEGRRKKVNNVYDRKLSSRLNDPQHSAIINIGQRVHTDDLSGHLLSKKEVSWTRLVIPILYMGEDSYDPVADIGRPDLTDPRTTKNELMFSARFGKAEIAELKEDLGTYGTAGQLQQDPTPLGGGLIKLHWFQRYKTPPIRQPEHRLRLSLDTANKDNEINDPSACGVWLSTQSAHYLLHTWVERLLYPDLKHKIIAMLEKWHPDECLIEDKASGQQLIQDLKRETFFNIIPIEPQGSKVVRMSNETPAIESGNVYLPETAPWLFDYEEELEQFPLSKRKDQVNFTSQFLRHVRIPKEIYVG